MADLDRGDARQEVSSERLRKLPRHVAFIMDGNGRWARGRGFRRLRGHEEGANSLRRLTRHCRSIGIREVTFFALSTENYQRRPATEIRFLLQLLRRYLIDERTELLDNNIRLKSLGHVEVFPRDVLSALEETRRLTEGMDGMTLRLALNYGARQEITDAVRRIAAEIASGRISADGLATLDEGDFRRYLEDPGMSDPDLLIRTAGEFRLSNFLLWQASYSELWVTPALWPDFDVDGLDAALEAYEARVRKYGALDGSSGEGERAAPRTTRRDGRRATSHGWWSRLGVGARSAAEEQRRGVPGYE